MNVYAQSFLSKLEDKALNYEVLKSEGAATVSVPYHQRRIQFLFSENHVHLSVVCDSVPEASRIRVVTACNKYNFTMRFLKLVVDQDDNLVILGDAILRESSAGDECFFLLIRAAQTVDDMHMILGPICVYC